MRMYINLPFIYKQLCTFFECQDSIKNLFDAEPGAALCSNAVGHTLRQGRGIWVLLASGRSLDVAVAIHDLIGSLSYCDSDSTAGSEEKQRGNGQKPWLSDNFLAICSHRLRFAASARSKISNTRRKFTMLWRCLWRFSCYLKQGPMGVTLSHTKSWLWSLRWSVLWRSNQGCMNFSEGFPSRTVQALKPMLGWCQLEESNRKFSYHLQRNSCW